MPNANAVFEGGGVKGIGLAGALAVAEKYGYRWNRVAGTSSGAIVAALLSVGYDAAELKTIMTNLDFGKFRDKGDLVDYIPGRFTAKLLSIVTDLGIYEGNFFLKWMQQQLQAKRPDVPEVTFHDLKIPLQVVASDLTNKRMLVLPDDLKDYGFSDPWRFPVAQAVRASMSIPFFFEPYVLTYRQDGQERKAFLVDGGLLSNFPVHLFDPRDKQLEVPTIGFLLKEPTHGKPQTIENVVDFVRALAATAMGAHDAYDLADQDYERTIGIDTGEISTTDFDITPEQKEVLYQSGVQAAEEFFAAFDFQEWLGRFQRQTRGQKR